MTNAPHYDVRGNVIEYKITVPIDPATKQHLEALASTEGKTPEKTAERLLRLAVKREAEMLMHDPAYAG